MCLTYFMKVTDLLASATKPIISLEILPPTKGKSIESIYGHLDPLMEFGPSFVNVTYHRAEQIMKKRADGTYEKVEIRKRPGTVSICAALMNKYKIEAVPHLICGGFTREEKEKALIDLNFLGGKNVLGLRGDAAANEKFFTANPNGHRYAEELVQQVLNLNQGKYMEEDIIDGVKTDFCIGVAGYPEKHFEAPNIETDTYYLKRKIELGADYIVTQMFFKNSHYYNFVNRCKENNINCPIIPGLKPLTSKRQLTTIPSIFNVEVPVDLVNELMKSAAPDAGDKIGEEWLYQQCVDLLKNKVPVLHFYTLGKPQVVHNVLKRLF